MTKKITVPCPACKKILARSIEFKGEGKLETMCPHCKKLVALELEQALKVKVTLPGEK